MTMDVKDALRVAELFEADDVISVPAMACRVMLKYIKELEVRVAEQLIKEQQQNV